MSFKAIRRFAAIAGFAVATLAGGIQAGTADDWPNQQITFVVALGPGGSADRTARLVAQRMQDELGVPIRVVNQEGGGGHVGHSYFLNMPDDGTFFLASSIHPYISNAILELDAEYSLDDFAFVNGQWTDIDLFAMNKDLPYGSLDEFMKAAKENPGKMKISVVPGSTGYINTLLVLEAYGISEDDVNIVTYESGSAARTAAAGGQVDLTVLGADGTVPIAEYIKPLAVAGDDRLPEWDAPTVNEALEPLGVKVPSLVGSMRGIAAHASFKEKYPERFEKFAAAYKAALADADFAADLKKQKIGAEWLGPERTTQIITSNFDILKRFQEEK
ncbi:Bug family tripartite tricarboxylate transporter substrate binding protein [Nitratireductor indicus]|uniref:Bug family tripartite tricarboxylate transporter substrate binding protein n=1 Tax=Nitratireductor indicus TaxID=721133 RepID=UPI0028765E40|nr:tripartite tricarboxylate transporter substrate binding protein [Nitratireductor indicus]MDS1138058.1 tripartite tricarboxylate transporter substrate binding protein [Nitratireductor indicus]